MESPSKPYPIEMKPEPSYITDSAPAPQIKQNSQEPYLAPAVVEHDPMNDTDQMTITHKERRFDSPQVYNP